MKLKAADTAKFIEAISERVRGLCARAAEVSMERLDDFEAGRPVRPFPHYRRELIPPQPAPDNDLDAAVLELMLDHVDVLNEHLDPLAARVRALIAARPKPRVKGSHDV